jgi:mutator protein MutT
MTPVDVCAAVIVRDGKVLVATRPHGSHLAGKWEFPGGKVHGSETHTACIRREIREDLGLEVLDPVPLCSVTHHYPDKSVRLHFLLCTVSACCEPVCHEGQEVRWVTPGEIADLDLAPADRAFLHSGRYQCDDGLADYEDGSTYRTDTLRTVRKLFV